jgi:predicted dehydrogenase
MNISRRHFLAASSLAGVSAWGGFASPRAFGANERLRLGIIGCGGIVREHIDSLLPMLAEENIEIATLCDVYDRRARQYAKQIEEKQAAPTQVGDYRRVLEDPDIDYVLIATPEHSHAHITLDALDAGKHVYVQKPITHTIEEAQAIVAKVNGTPLKLQVGVQGTADDSYRVAREAILAGTIGKVVSAQIDYVRDYALDNGPWRTGAKGDKPLPDGLDWAAWQRPAAEREWDPARYFEWRCYRDYSGGIATDLFVHRVTRLLVACGLTFPTKVAGMGGIYSWPDGRDLPDSMELLAEYPAVEGITDGMTLHVLGTMTNENGNAHCIRGTAATIYFEDPGFVIKAEKTGEVIATHTRTGSESMVPHHKNHHKAIREGAALDCPAELGLYGLAVCRMANLSWFEGRMMRWNTETQKAEAV